MAVDQHVHENQCTEGNWSQRTGFNRGIEIRDVGLRSIKNMDAIETIA